VLLVPNQVLLLCQPPMSHWLAAIQQHKQQPRGCVPQQQQQQQLRRPNPPC
jgi:hypothetical protein